MFAITPQQGSLSPTERPANVQVTFKSNREIAIREQPILRCQVIEPSIGEAGEMIASIPIKISVRSLFVRYVGYYLVCLTLIKEVNSVIACTLSFFLIMDVFHLSF